MIVAFSYAWRRMGRVIVVLVSCFALVSCVHAKSISNCANSISTIDELMENSEFIGLYTVLGKEPVSDVFEQNLELFSFNMRLKSSVSRRAPRKIELVGAKPDAVIPPIYFHLADRHREMTEKDALILGLAYPREGANGNCIYTPTFVEGYSYLIFGGANSRAAFEPILSTEYDPFYNEVKRRVEAERLRQN